MAMRLSLRASRLCCRYYSTTPTSAASATAPPLLLKIRKDMKAALQARDTNRLSVLRSLLSQTLNASKTSNPINTDLQLLALIRKTANASRIANSEFRNAGRLELAEKEDSQLKIMEEYANGVQTLREEDIAKAVKDIVEKMRGEGGKAQIRDVLNKVFAPDALGNKPVERGEVVRIVKQVLAEP